MTVQLNEVALRMRRASIAARKAALLKALFKGFGKDQARPIFRQLTRGIR